MFTVVAVVVDGIIVQWQLFWDYDNCPINRWKLPLNRLPLNRGSAVWSKDTFPNCFLHGAFVAGVERKEGGRK